MLRFAVSGLVQQWGRSAGFPYGTLAVSLLGCLTTGVLAHFAEARGLFTPENRAFLFVGLLGGFITFSTFDD